MNLTAIDNADGTITVNVGSSSGAWTVYQTALNKLSAGLVWASLLTGSGDGTQNVTIDDGSYLLYGADSAGVTAPIYIAADSGAPDVWERCLVAIRDQIVALGLVGIDSRRIVNRKVPLTHFLPKINPESLGKDVDDAAPAIIVSPVPEQRNRSEQLNKMMKTGYRGRVSIFEAHHDDPADNRPKHLKWRNQITKAFDGQILASVTEVSQCFVEPGQLYPLDSWTSRKKDAQSVVITCQTWESTA